MHTFVKVKTLLIWKNYGLTPFSKLTDSGAWSEKRIEKFNFATNMRVTNNCYDGQTKWY